MSRGAALVMTGRAGLVVGFAPGATFTVRSRRAELHALFVDLQALLTVIHVADVVAFLVPATELARIVARFPDVLAFQGAVRRDRRHVGGVVAGRGERRGKESEKNGEPQGVKHAGEPSRCPLAVQGHAPRDITLKQHPLAARESRRGALLR